MVLQPKLLSPSSNAIFDYPLLYLGGDRAFPPLPLTVIRRLRRHLILGGTLLVDSADAQAGSEFDRSVRRLARRIFPKAPLTRIDPAATVYKSFYLLRRPVGRVADLAYIEGVQRNGRWLLIYSQHDLAGAWAKDSFGQWEHGVHPGGPRQREMAFRLGINIVLYALCLDYKADQVHIPFILKRRRWRAR